MSEQRKFEILVSITVFHDVNASREEDYFEEEAKKAVETMLSDNLPNHYCGYNGFTYGGFDIV